MVTSPVGEGMWTMRQACPIMASTVPSTKTGRLWRPITASGLVCGRRSHPDSDGSTAMR